MAYLIKLTLRIFIKCAVTALLNVLLCPVSSLAMADTTTVNFTGRINQSGCTVNGPSELTIMMGDWFASDFSGTGTATAKQRIPVSLNCSAGASIEATIQGDADPSQAGTLNLLSSGSGSSAGGIGVQLTDGNGNPLQLNTAFEMASNVGEGSFSPNWYARYIQTGPTITAGPADASATLTLNYR